MHCYAVYHLCNTSNVLGTTVIVLICDCVNPFFWWPAVQGIAFGDSAKPATSEPARLGATPPAADVSASASAVPAVPAIAHTHNNTVISTSHPAEGTGALHPTLVFYPVMNGSSAARTDEDVEPLSTFLSSTLQVAVSIPRKAGKDSAKNTGHRRAGLTSVQRVDPGLSAETGGHLEVRGGTGRSVGRRPQHTHVFPREPSHLKPWANALRFTSVSKGTTVARSDPINFHQELTALVFPATDCLSNPTSFQDVSAVLACLASSALLFAFEHCTLGVSHAPPNINQHTVSGVGQTPQVLL